jgi:hypothetical protein
VSHRGEDARFDTPIRSNHFGRTRSRCVGPLRASPAGRRIASTQVRPRQVVDVKTNQFVLWVRGGATGLWTVELLFDRTGTPYLANGWRRFCQRHEIVAGHFVVFNYDVEHQITVSVFDQTMCRWHYVAAARGKAAVSSSSSPEDD